MRTINLGLFLSLAFTSTLLAHGEDKKGPHGGFVRMPGAFHTEVVTKGAKIYIYLLDINWKNPTTKDSTVSATLKRDSRQDNLKCSAESNRFVCDLPKSERLATGQLVVIGKRGSFPEGAAIYDLPLKLFEAKDKHEGHH